jgi:hypothetical protein
MEKDLPHPQEHPAFQTYGLDEKECADIRLATQSSLWRYLTESWVFRPPWSIVLIILLAMPPLGHIGWVFFPATVGLVLFNLVVRIYDWMSKRRLGRKLGY